MFGIVRIVRKRNDRGRDGFSRLRWGGVERRGVVGIYL